MRVLTTCLVLGVVAPPPPPAANSSSSGRSWREPPFSCFEQAMHVSIASNLVRENVKRNLREEKGVCGGLINGEAHQICRLEIPRAFKHSVGEEN